MVYTKVSGAWVPVLKPFIKNGASWEGAECVYQKDNGAWVQIACYSKYLIDYTMDSFISASAARYIINEGTGGSVYDAEMFSGNHLYLNGTDQSVDYSIIHDLDANIVSSFYGVSNGSDATVTHTGYNDGIDLAITTASTDNAKCWVYHNVSDVYGARIKLSFDATVNSGTAIINRIRTGAYNNVNYTITNGYNEFILDGSATKTNPLGLEFYTDKLFDIGIRNLKSEEVTIPANSYRTMYNSDTKQFEQLDHTQLSVSTVEKVDVSHQCWFNHTKALTQAELDQLNANPNLIVAVYRDDKVLVDGFSKVGIGNFMMPIEGTLGNKYVVDLSVPFGSNLVLNGDFASGDFTHWGVTDLDSSIVDGKAKLIATTQDAGRIITNSSIQLDASKFYVFSYDLTLEKLNGSTKAELQWNNNGTHTYTQEGTYHFGTIIDGATDQTIYAVFKFISNDVGDVFYIDNVSIREVTAYEIQNYTDSVRSTLVNQNFGTQNLLLKQDAAGIPTGTAAQGTIIGSDDGRYIEVPDVPTDYLITECTETIYGDDSTNLTIETCQGE